jgi:hypothetical protein
MLILGATDGGRARTIGGIMHRPTLLAAAAAFIAVAALTGTVPASAATAQPAPPTRVAVTGEADAATVTWASGKTVRGVRVTGYTVGISPVEKQSNHGVDDLGPRTFSDRFGYLTPGVTYTFTVRAKSGRAVSAPVSVRYTRPATHAESLYAVNEAGALVRRPVSGGGTWTTIAAAGSGYAVDGAGTAYVSSAGGATITAYPENGRSAVVATGLPASSGVLYADDAGDVFFTQNKTVFELPHGSSTTRPVGPGIVAAVSPNGWVVAQTPSTNVLVYDPSGVQHSISGTPYFYLIPIGVDSAGDVYFRNPTPDGSGYTVGVVPTGSATYTSLLTPEVTVAVTHDGALTALQTAAGDTSARTLWKRTASGSVTTTPISGVVVGSGAPAAADRAGDVFVSPTSGPNTGLVRVPATGGTVEQLGTATYRELSVH